MEKSKRFFEKTQKKLATHVCAANYKQKPG